MAKWIRDLSPPEVDSDFNPSTLIYLLTTVQKYMCRVVNNLFWSPIALACIYTHTVTYNVYIYTPTNKN